MEQAGSEEMSCTALMGNRMGLDGVVGGKDGDKSIALVEMSGNIQERAVPASEGDQTEHGGSLSFVLKKQVRVNGLLNLRSTSIPSRRA